MEEFAVSILRKKFQAMSSFLDERGRRLWAATEAQVMEYGGISAVSKATGLSRTTIHAGLQELMAKPTKRPVIEEHVRIRSKGGGRKSLLHHNPGITNALDGLVEPTSRGDPQSPLRWTCKSTRRLAQELTDQGYRIGDRKVADLLHEMKYSLQANAKTLEGKQHPDRNAQFEYINRQTKAFQKRGQPVISIDTKKKEIVGNFKNGGKEWHPQGTPEETLTHDFEDKELGKAIPYGVYDPTDNSGWVSVGVDHDTAEFATDTIAMWWKQMGRKTYPGATELLIMADGGGSNSSKSRLWKLRLQDLANALTMKISVCHFPPGTSKWNKIEHKMFSFITQNWRGKPLVNLETIIKLIGSTSTRTGLLLKAKVNNAKYETGIKVDDAELEKISIKRDSFHGDWNYSVLPKCKYSCSTYLCAVPKTIAHNHQPPPASLQ